MPESESFDAFYARTVWSVTSQMHELAANDGMADHAIREAYAKAYQQWYQVSGYRDTEGWVLATAKDAYQRRLGEAGAGGYHAAQASDSGTWPGIYRPRPGARSDTAAPGQAPADPEATMAAAGEADRGRPAGAYAPGAYPSDAYPNDAYTADARAGEYAGGGHAAGVPGEGAQGTGGTAAGTRATATLARLFGRGAPARPGAPAGAAGSGQPGSRRTTAIAAAAIAALLIAGIAYLAVGGNKAKAKSAAGPANSAQAVARPKPHMLPAGRSGRRSAIPWSLVGSGWALAELSTAAPDPAGSATGGGTYTTYLVDPEGGRYSIASSPGSAAPQLIAWSGDGHAALFGTGGSASGGTTDYSLLNVRTGQLTPLPLPAGVVAVGFTRPDGLNILAVHQGPAEFRLQRYNLAGQFQASLGSLPRKQAEDWPADGCSGACAQSSPGGLTDAWGTFGDEMQLLSNAGGLIRKLHVPGSGQPPSCVPVSWWDPDTILANCAAVGGPGDATRLWLVPADGGAPSPLTAAAGSPAGNGQIEGAWQAGSAVYVTSTTFTQCSGAPSGPGGVSILRIGQAGSGSTVAIPGSTNNVNRIVGSDGRRLLILAQTSCPGTSSLLWFSPSAGRAVTVLTGPASQVGVIAAVPFGNGPTAISGGQQ